MASDTKVHESKTGTMQNKLYLGILSLYFIIFLVFGLVTKLKRTNKFLIWLILPISAYLILIYLHQKLDIILEKDKLKLFWIFSGLLRFLVLFFPVGLSDDIYRYIWDGKVQHAGINPYLYAPSDDQISFLRSETWHLINNPTISTPYPPISQVFFYLVTALNLEESRTILLIRIIIILIDVGIIELLLRIADYFGINRRNIAIYSFSPLVLFEFAGNGHNDAIAVFFMLLSIYLAFIKRDFPLKNTLSAMFLAFGILTKVFPIVLLPFLGLRWKLQEWIGFIIPFVITFVLYNHPGINPFYPPGQMIFVMHFQFNSSLFRVVDFIIQQLVGNQFLTRYLYIIVMVLISVKYLNFYMKSSLSNKNYKLLEYTNSIMLFGLLFGPDIHPWYILWILPIGILLNNLIIVTWSMTILLSYQVYPLYDTQGIFLESPIIILVQYIPVYFLLILNYYNKLPRILSSESKILISE